MNVLYLSYNGALEPLGRSQVLPYLRELAERYQHRFHLISYEKPRDWDNPTLIAAARARLDGQGIAWHPLRYHQRPTLPATLYDLARGLPRALRLAQRQRIEAIHVRSYVPMLLGIALKRLLGIPLIFDMRGLWADERADVGQCTRESRQYRAIKALERASLRQSDQIIVLTERVREALMEQAPLKHTARPLTVIPCCTDMELFQRDEAARTDLRARYGWGHKTVVVVSGSLGGWYMTDELAALYAAWRQSQPGLHLLVLTHSDPGLIMGPLKAHGVDSANYTVEQVAANQMPAWLSAADVAVSLIQPFYSKIASSPTKQAEYLACGLPIVANAGIGDSDALIANNQIGIVFEGWDAETYRRLWLRVQALRSDPGLAARCRAVAQQQLSLDSGVARYQQVYASLGLHKRTQIA
jgi:glycosyltransferase involved in cell wall biosynthesis